MKRLVYIVVAVCMVGWFILPYGGCEQKRPGPADAVQVSRQAPVAGVQAAGPLQQQTEEQPGTGEPGASIVFENTVYDFGEISVNEKADCEFHFRNAGQAVLKIAKIRSSCGCTVPSLSRNEYQGGEQGTIKVSYSGQAKPGAVAKSIYVPTNDEKNPTVKLTIKATVVEMVEVMPDRLDLSLTKRNAGAAKIVLKSRDGAAFSIKDFVATDEVLTAEFDPNVSASQFSLEPKVNLERLRRNRTGNIRIDLTHPKCSWVMVYYNLPSRFLVDPARIVLHNVEANKPELKDVLIRSSEEEHFSITSADSKSGYIKVISQLPATNSVKLALQITPPATKQRYFSDILTVTINEDEKLDIRCTGFYGGETRRTTVGTAGEESPAPQEPNVAPTGPLK